MFREGPAIAANKTYQAIDGSSITYTDGSIKNSVFIECKFVKTKFIGVNLSSTRFERCDFSGAHFQMCDLRKATFTACNLLDAATDECQMVGCSMLTCITQGFSIKRPPVGQSDVKPVVKSEIILPVVSHMINIAAVLALAAASKGKSLIGPIKPVATETISIRDIQDTHRSGLDNAVLLCSRRELFDGI